MVVTSLLGLGFLAGLYAPTAQADFTFGEPVNTSVNDDMPSVSSDGLELHFQSGRAGGYGACDLWMARRAISPQARLERSIGLPFWR